MIAIVDYQMGNLRSVQKGFEKVGCEAVVTGEPEEVARADKVVLPGVGAFDIRLLLLLAGIRPRTASGIQQNSRGLASHGPRQSVGFTITARTPRAAASRTRSSMACLSRK